MVKHKCIMIVIIVILFSVNTLACIWDSDTIIMERQRFPSTLELITGKFVRHSEEFYQWRIKDRLEKLKVAPEDLSYYDDLAVAYDKTGQDEKAIEIMLKKETLKPNMYETYANLGTFYIHSEQYKQGLEYIDKALEINPNAHFGREIYQKYLAEYVMDKDKLKGLGFAGFLRRKGKSYYLGEEETKKAVKGVLGMMRFGNYRSSVLLSALGSLLEWDKNTENTRDAKQLAARAYLKASYETKDEELKRLFRQKAEQALVGQYIQVGSQLKVVKLDLVERNFKNELIEADRWYQVLQNNEITWVNQGSDPEKEFIKKYYNEPQLTFSTKSKHKVLDSLIDKEIE